MLVTTIGAFIFQIGSAARRQVDGVAKPDLLIIGVSIALIVMSVMIVIEVLQILSRKGKGPRWVSEV